MTDVLTWPGGPAPHTPQKIQNPDRGRPPGSPIGCYVLGASFGGLLVGLAFGTFGALLSRKAAAIEDSARIIVGAVIVAAAWAEWSGGLGRFPERRWRVPERWLFWKHRSGLGLAYGFLMGMGWLTQLRHATAYALAGILVLAPTTGAAAAVGLTYGTCRGLILAATWLGDRRGRRLDWKIDRGRQLSALVLSLSAMVAYAVVILD